MDAERFGEIVEQALDEIPQVIAARVRNLVVLVEDEPPEDSRRSPRAL
jgi:predicted Zn-dependent protease with MMP-like domain